MMGRAELLHDIISVVHSMHAMYHLCQKVYRLTEVRPFSWPSIVRTLQQISSAQLRAVCDL